MTCSISCKTTLIDITCRSKLSTHAETVYKYCRVEHKIRSGATRIRKEDTTAVINSSLRIEITCVDIGTTMNGTFKRKFEFDRTGAIIHIITDSKPVFTTRIEEKRKLCLCTAVIVVE